MSTVDRKLLIYMMSINWCLKCGKITDMVRVRTGLPGIGEKRCISCDSHVQVNYNEDDDISIEDDMITVPEDFCPQCKNETTFRSTFVEDEFYNGDKIFKAKVCERCNSVIVDFGGEQAFFSNKNQRRSDIIEVG